MRLVIYEFFVVTPLVMLVYLHENFPQGFQELIETIGGNVLLRTELGREIMALPEETAEFIVAEIPQIVGAASFPRPEIPPA